MGALPDPQGVGAKDADIKFIAVTYGFGFNSKADVAECIGVTNAPFELTDILL